MGILDKYYRDGGLMTADDFRNPEVPGATAGVDPVTLQPYVDQQNEAAMQRVAGDVTENAEAMNLVSTELTNKQKQENEELQKKRDADIAALDAEKAKLKAGQKAADAGYVPENQQVVEGGLAPQPGETREAAAQAAYGLGATMPETDEFLAAMEGSGTVDHGTTEQQAAVGGLRGMQLYDHGANREQEAVAAAGGAKVAEIQADAEIGQIMGQAMQEDMAADRILMEKRESLEAKRKEIDQQIVAEIERNIKPPSPSALGLIGVFLNGLIAPMQGGRNTALEIVERQMKREVDIEMSNKQRRLQGLQKRRGIASDEEMGIEKQQAATEIALAKKYKSMQLQLEARLKSPTLTAQQRANTQALIGQLQQKQGAFQLDAAERIFNMEMKREQAMLNRAKLLAKKKGGGRGKGKLGKGSVDADIAAGNTYYNPRSGQINYGSKLDAEQKDRERTASRGFDIKIGDKTHKGLVVKHKALADKIEKSVEDYQVARQRIQRIVKLVPEKGKATNIKWGAFAASNEAQLAQSEFTQLMVAMKNMWELGAIQKPDEKLIEGAAGMSPEDFMTFIGERWTVSDVRKVLKNFQAGGEEQIKHMIRGASELGDNATIVLDKPYVGKDIDRGMNEPKAESTQIMLGNLSATLQTFNKDKRGEGESDEELLADVSKYADLLSDNYVASIVGGTGESGKKKAGGVTSKGNEVMELRRMAKATNRKDVKNILNKAVENMVKRGANELSAMKKKQKAIKQVATPGSAGWVTDLF